MEEKTCDHPIFYLVGKGVKQLRRETDHSYTYTPTIKIHGAINPLFHTLLWLSAYLSTGTTSLLISIKYVFPMMETNEFRRKGD
jgi:hypothetical protein